MKKLHKALEDKINETVCKGILPTKCLLSHKTLTGLEKELPKNRRSIVMSSSKDLRVYGSKAGILFFHVDNRFNYGNFKVV